VTPPLRFDPIAEAQRQWDAQWGPETTAAVRRAATEATRALNVEQAISRGLHVDDFARRLSFFLNAQIDFFEDPVNLMPALLACARSGRTDSPKST